MSTQKVINQNRRAIRLGNDLCSALYDSDFKLALDFCRDLCKLGAETFSDLIPRGTTCHSATERIPPIERVSQLIVKENNPISSSEEIGLFCRMLAFWAGASALPFLIKKVCYTNPTEALAGINALRTIGGTQAFEFLQQLSSQANLDLETQEAAQLAVSELIHGGVDYWIGPSRVEILKNATTDDIAIRDSLTDPYEWDQASKLLGDYLKQIIEMESPAIFQDMGIDQSQVGLKLKEWFDNSEANQRSQEEIIQSLGFIVNSKKIVVLKPLIRLFRTEDLIAETQLRPANDWWAVELKEDSLSTKFFPRLGMKQWLNLEDATEASMIDQLYTTFDNITTLASLFVEPMPNPVPELTIGFACLQYCLANALPARNGLTLPDLLKIHLVN